MSLELAVYTQPDNTDWIDRLWSGENALPCDNIEEIYAQRQQKLLDKVNKKESTKNVKWANKEWAKGDACENAVLDWLITLMINRWQETQDSNVAIVIWREQIDLGLILYDRNNQSKTFADSTILARFAQRPTYQAWRKQVKLNPSKSALKQRKYDQGKTSTITEVLPNSQEADRELTASGRIKEYGVSWKADKETHEQVAKERKEKNLSQPEYMAVLLRHHKIVEEAMTRLNMTESELVEYLK